MRSSRVSIGLRRGAGASILALTFVLCAVAPAMADFPYPALGPTEDFDDLHLTNQVPDDICGDSNEFKYSASADPANTINNARPTELGGVRGASVVDKANPGCADSPPYTASAKPTAWKLTTGRPDVTLAVLDSGIEWQNAGAMGDLRHKIRINRGEAPRPLRANGTTCAYDCNDDHVFNVEDYANDSRINLNDGRRDGPGGMLTPQDVLIAFSDAGFSADGKAGGSDDDDNGFVDDLVGWDFLDNDNDPYDDVHYGHGTGEARGSTSEADNRAEGDNAGSCPNCMVIPLRVGDSFIADINRFAAAVTYATDNDVQVVQSALGTLNGSTTAREAVDYAYRHGVTTILSAADEAAQHNNQPSMPHSILVNSVTKSAVDEVNGAFSDGTEQLNDAIGQQFTPPQVPDNSYLAFNGCTNFNAKITLAIPSTSCSSDAVGVSSGLAGLIYSAAYNAEEQGKLAPYPDGSTCTTGEGEPCVITPNEVRQILASGRINLDGDGSLEAFERQADDINFLSPGPTASLSDDGPEAACFPARQIGCTGPYGSGNVYRTLLNVNRPTYGGPVALEPYPARLGTDQFYGYGRVNMVNAASALLPGSGDSKIPPEAEIYSPEWYEQVDPGEAPNPGIAVEGEVFAREASYSCQVLVAPGQYPNQKLTTDTPPGDFLPLPSGSGWCDGRVHSGAEAHQAHFGNLATVPKATLKGLFPIATAFDGPEPEASPATSNGRPAQAPHSFTFKVVVSTGSGADQMTGEDQRTAYLHRDADMLPGFPHTVAFPDETGAPDYPTGDGESSPAFADLDGDNRNDLIYASSDGIVHAVSFNPTSGAMSELPGWPVAGDVAEFVGDHVAAKGYDEGAVTSDNGGAMLASVAVGDANRDGVPEVYGADYEGKLYGWGADGERVFTEEANPQFSGRPLVPFEEVRKGETNRTQHGFIGSPVLADIAGDADLELIASSMDRHVYAWHAADSNPGAPGGASNVDGFPELVVDRTKVQKPIDPTTHRIQFLSNAGSNQQGGLIDTPAVGDIDPDHPGPEIVVGTNEAYQEAPNTSAFSNPSFAVAGGSGLIEPGNTRLYALDSRGDRDGDPNTDDGVVAGWPVKIAFLNANLLPVVGEGITGPPVIGPADCGQNGGAGSKIGAISYASPGYILNADGSSCYGADSGIYRTLATDQGASTDAVDRPIIPAVGGPAFGALSAGAGNPSFLVPAAGLIRALDLVLPEYQPTGQDYIGAWDTTTGQFQPNFPQTQNDLSFLTGPSIADIDGLPGEEVLSGSASLDLNAYNAAGIAVPGWPKLTTDWTIANPLIGSFGTLDTDAAARKVVIGMTRSGYLNGYATDAPACSPGSWPRFHHDNANSGDYSRDAVLPGKPIGFAAASDNLTFKAPGDDLLCGAATKYELRTSSSPITESNFATATPLTGAPAAPAAAGADESFAVPAGAQRYVAIRAVDDQDNVGRVASLDLQPTSTGGGTGGGSTGGGDTGGGTGTGGGAGTGGGTATGGGNPGPDCAAVISGTEGGDRLKGTEGSDRIRALAGKDKVRAAGSNDCVNAGPDGDSVRGEDGDDRIGGDDGPDRLRGDDGDDRITGGDDPDRISGGEGDDIIRANGDGTRDRIDCGDGKDTVFADERDSVRNCERVR